VTDTLTRSGRYAGKTADERRAERRARLMTAGKGIWIRDGWAAVSMRAVCADAGLTDRYFYESFTNADDLRCSIWDELRDDIIGVLHEDFVSSAGVPGVQRLRSSIEAVVRHVAAHPDDAQIFYGDHAGSAALEARHRDGRRATMQLVVELAEPLLPTDVDREVLAVRIRMAIGGFLELMEAWQAGEVSGTIEDVVEHARTFGELLAADLVPSGGPSRHPAVGRRR
jgi:AcrR family transcriptional regulator